MRVFQRNQEPGAGKPGSREPAKLDKRAIERSANRTEGKYGSRLRMFVRLRLFVLIRPLICRRPGYLGLAAHLRMGRPGATAADEELQNKTAAFQCR